jgi:hypothetical protein
MPLADRYELGFDVFVAFVLDAFAKCAANERAGERMVMIDERTGRGANERAAGLTVVFAMMRRRIRAAMMMRFRERCIRRNQYRQAQYRGLNFHRKRAHKQTPPAVVFCEIDA